ncbi:hypothetical protein PR202_gb08242 [Eleusine coracana subsp. coracana]|uniref:Uncharacterized protein n=1 Tax=Eleusine coracana subsp. coracana TaxID=191504 RepID=A0AAV5EBP6_ELECO|nr:hypothetical protein PR202_gb08242 [Eleusine coracana subsp. coracana]
MLFQVGGQGARPTFFEMSAAQQLPASLRAALTYSLGVNRLISFPAPRFSSLALTDWIEAGRLRFTSPIILIVMAKFYYYLQVFALRRSFLHKVLDYEDEFFTLLMSVLESHSLRTTGLSS